VRVRLEGPPALTAEITAAALDELALSPGAQVWAVVKATEVRLYPG
jgi:molybdate transport system ATP-binding protein